MDQAIIRVEQLTKRYKKATRNAVDGISFRVRPGELMRGVYYGGQPEYPKAVLASPAFNAVVIAVLFAGFMTAGTWLFVRGERNR